MLLVVLKVYERQYWAYVCVLIMLFKRMFVSEQGSRATCWIARRSDLILSVFLQHLVCLSNDSHMCPGGLGGIATARVRQLMSALGGRHTLLVSCQPGAGLEETPGVVSVWRPNCLLECGPTGTTGCCCTGPSTSCSQSCLRIHPCICCSCAQDGVGPPVSSPCDAC